jgi:hypothetical protein
MERNAHHVLFLKLYLFVLQRKELNITLIKLGLKPSSCSLLHCCNPFTRGTHACSYQKNTQVSKGSNIESKTI